MKCTDYTFIATIAASKAAAIVSKPFNILAVSIVAKVSFSEEFDRIVASFVDSRIHDATITVIILATGDDCLNFKQSARLIPAEKVH